MTIQEAIKSERPVRRQNQYQYLYFCERKTSGGVCIDRGLFMIGIDDGVEFPISKSDILADDWEIRGE